MDFFLLGLVSFISALGSSAYYFHNLSIKKLESSYKKITDRDLLVLVKKLGQINATELVKNSNLDEKEANFRLKYLYEKGCLKFKNKEYKLFDDINFDIQLPEEESISAKSIIWLANQYNGVLYASMLIAAKGITFFEAKRTLKKFFKERILFFLNDPTSQAKENPWFADNPHDRRRTGYLLMPNLRTDSVSAQNIANLNPQPTANQEIKKTSDAEVIELAIQGKGKITLAILCLKKDISVEEAEKILEKLYKKGIFELKVSEYGTIEYHLTDENLLET